MISKKKTPSPEPETGFYDPSMMLSLLIKG
jgi:hypothetical protein